MRKVREEAPSGPGMPRRFPVLRRWLSLSSLFPPPPARCPPPPSRLQWLASASYSIHRSPVRKRRSLPPDSYFSEQLSDLAKAKLCGCLRSRAHAPRPAFFMLPLTESLPSAHHPPPPTVPPDLLPCPAEYSSLLLPLPLALLALRMGRNRSPLLVVHREV